MLFLKPVTVNIKNKEQNKTVSKKFKKPRMTQPSKRGRAQEAKSRQAKEGSWREEEGNHEVCD
jgi:hypothetical protein